MRRLLFLTIALLPVALQSSIGFRFNVGPTYEYTRYEYGSLADQSGTMIGPVASLDLDHSCGLSGYVGFKGLFDIPHICSKDGLLIDSIEYEANAHIGYDFESFCGCFLITPFTGVDFTYLRYTNDVCGTNIMRNRYFQVNVPLGLKIWHDVNDTFEWGLKAYYDIDVWTRLKAVTPDVLDTQCDKIELCRSHRFHITAPCEFHFNICDYCFNVGYAPLFTWQRFGKSECPQALNIPCLEQWHLGHTFTLGITF